MVPILVFLNLGVIMADRLTEAFEYLKKAEFMTEPSRGGARWSTDPTRLRIRIDTFHTFGMYYRRYVFRFFVFFCNKTTEIILFVVRFGKLRSALQCMSKALRVHERLRGAREPAVIHLNMCAMLSQLGRYAVLFFLAAVWARRDNLGKDWCVLTVLVVGQS
jgi:hypothetical protein